MTPQEYLADQLREFAVRFVIHRKSDIRKRKLENTESLLDSVSAKTNGSSTTNVLSMVVIARGYGRLQDMRRRYNKVGGKEMLREIEEWVERVGVQKFAKDGKVDYEYKYKNQLPEKVINRIAWGIITTYRKNKTAKKRSWWNRGKTADIAEFYALMLKGYAKVVAEDAKKKIEG